MRIGAQSLSLINEWWWIGELFYEMREAIAL